MKKILIENGTVVDGTGAAALLADVLVEGETIAAVIPRGASAAPRSADCETLDASGCIVSPGFIDAHSHSDAYLLIEPWAPSKLSQGITTEINGNCGGSAIPRYGEAKLSGDWASMTYPEPGGGVARAPGPTWRSLAEYRDLLSQIRPAINTVQFAGHNTIRSSVMGYRPDRATPDDTAALCRMLEKCLDEGAWGLSTGLIYQPGKWSEPCEVEALARVAAARGAFYSTHMRSEGDSIIEAIEEVENVVRKTGVRAEISHLKTSGRNNWGKIDAVLGKIESAVESGMLLGADRYPYCAAGTELDVVFPDWAGAGGRDAELARLRDPALRSRIESEIASSGMDWNTVTIGGGWSDVSRPWSGRTVAEAAAALGMDPARAVCDFVLADETRTGAFFFSMCEENMRRILARPWVVAGSDASLRSPEGPLGADHPHPRAYGTMPVFFRALTGADGSSPALCTREEAVRRMTGATAERFGIRARGRIAKGFFADIAVWREDGFRSRATYAAPHAFAAGMEAVFVNGELSWRAGAPLGRRCGRFLERA